MTEDLEEGNLHSGYWGRALHIANTLTLPFYLLPFYLLREDGGPGRGKLTLQLLGERALHIANPLTLPFYLLPFYLFTLLLSVNYINTNG